MKAAARTAITAAIAMAGAEIPAMAAFSGANVSVSTAALFVTTATIPSTGAIDARRTPNIRITLCTPPSRFVIQSTKAFTP